MLKRSHPAIHMKTKPTYLGGQSYLLTRLCGVGNAVLEGGV